MSEPIRILQVFGRLDRGGAETMIMNLYRNMDRSQVQFDFMLHTREECEYCAEVRMLGGRIFCVPPFKGSNFTEYRSAWKAFLREHREYSILHSHVRSTAALYLPIAKKNGLITIIHSHNTASGRGASALLKTMLQYPLRYEADYLFACSRKAGEWLYGKKACGTDRFYLVKNAIQISKFAYNETNRNAIRERYEIEKNCLVIGHIGRFELQKNHQFLLEVFEEIKKIVGKTTLILIGEGELQEKIRKNAGAGVVFTGVQKNIEEWMSAMDLFLFPSRFEGLPVTLIEAQAAGLPILASDTITQEISLTESVHMLNLKDGAKLWAAEATKMAGHRYSSEEAAAMLKKSGYHVESTARWLQNFYLKQMEESYV